MKNEFNGGHCYMIINNGHFVFISLCLPHFKVLLFQNQGNKLFLM